MADIEKVINGLECHRIDDNHRINCTDCPYYVDDDNHIRCVNDLHDDALTLLKEQEETIKRLQDKLFANPDAWIHCKDCKFSKPDWEKAVWCEREDCRRHENWYCADGEEVEQDGQS